MVPVHVRYSDSVYTNAILSLRFFIRRNVLIKSPVCTHKDGKFIANTRISDEFNFKSS